MVQGRGDGHNRALFDLGETGMKMLFSMVLFSFTIYGISGREIIKQYGLQDFEISIEKVDASACSVLAESTCTWYNVENGFVDSVFKYVLSDKPNCCRWMDFYDHKLFPTGSRATRIYRLNHDTRDTVEKTINEYDKYKNLIVSDNIDFVYGTRAITVYEYDAKGRRTQYQHIAVGRNGVHDTLRTQVTTYAKGKCPEKLSTVGRDLHWQYQCTDFDSTEAALAVKDSVKRVHYLKFYDSKKRLVKCNDYFWNLEGNPLMKVTFYEYDKGGDLLKKIQFGPPDLFNRINSPDEFVPRLIDYFTRDEKGRVIKFVRKQRAEED